jgi:pSer/pThr/pTyr-binding forkhead associated (FHA) protein
MVRCPACGNENPPEYPPEEYPFCIECGAQLGTFRPPPAGRDQSPDPYGRGQAGQYGGAGPDQYRQPRPDPYDGGRQDPYARQDPYDRGQAQAPYLPPPVGPARLILESGLGKVEYPLDAPVVTIGRSRSNDISLEDARVSRHHARIVRDGQGFLIEDLNSRNGTRVDERAVRDSATLADGSIVRIGDSVFRFTTAPAAPREARPVPGPSPFGGPSAAPARPAGQDDRSVPEVFLAPWNPVQCPSCQGLKTMRPIVYGPAAQTPGAQTAARRGEVTLGEGPPRPNAPNAECRACGTRVRIVTTGG